MKTTDHRSHDGGGELTTGRRPSPVVKRLLRLPAALYEHDAGWLLGHRFVCLTHVGRTSGRRYRTVLEVVGSDRASGEVMVIAGLGRRTDWYRNIAVRPAVEVAIGRHRFRPEHRELGEDEAVAVMTEYGRRHPLIAPLLPRVLTWLVGWHYDGSDAAKRRLVRERPIIAFRPVARRSA
ncbi:MAG TPA: nitroreductase family deazaflavin-dependent oxidoreductase [Streptosporangiales bacterium]